MNKLHTVGVGGLFLCLFSVVFLYNLHTAFTPNNLHLEGTTAFMLPQNQRDFGQKMNLKQQK